MTHLFTHLNKTNNQHTSPTLRDAGKYLLTMTCWKSPVDESDWADRSVCRCASLSLRPLTCDDMKGHRWGPWEQRRTQLPLKVTTFPSIRLRGNVWRAANHVNRQSSVTKQRAEQLQNTILTALAHLQRIPQTFQMSWKAKMRQHASPEGAAPFGRLCELNIYTAQ